ncbi:MAG: biotin--[acetyl-CoA-carboxylase] ligase [Planctomycetaceae bacterium]|nr:biotin--[acetyl-CoA-carboxylase] ligase [Planctomycetaceae bacterium]
MNRNSRQVFDVGRIRQETGIRHVEYHAQLASTNATAVELAGLLLDVAPALVLTGRQTAGRGRGANAWWSTTGALTFSLLIDGESTGLPREQRGMISLAAGAAVRDVLDALLGTCTAMIKWPNDVYVDQRKICGILTEQTTRQTRSAIIIGIGINVNNSLADAPGEIREAATSLFDVTGASFDLSALLIDVANQLDYRISQLVHRDAALIRDINSWSLLSDRFVTISAGPEIHAGRCEGIDGDGCLLLRNASGAVTKHLSGIVQQWK